MYLGQNPHLPVTRVPILSCLPLDVYSLTQETPAASYKPYIPPLLRSRFEKGYNFAFSPCSPPLSPSSAFSNLAMASTTTLS